MKYKKESFAGFLLILLIAILISSCGESDCEIIKIENKTITKIINKTINQTVIEYVEVEKIIRIECPAFDCGNCLSREDDVRLLQMRYTSVEGELEACLLMNNSGYIENLTEGIKELESQVSSFDDRAKEINDQYKNCTYYQEI